MWRDMRVGMLMKRVVESWCGGGWEIEDGNVIERGSKRGWGWGLRGGEGIWKNITLNSYNKLVNVIRNNITNNNLITCLNII